MEKDETLELLCKLGFTRYETQAYYILLISGSLHAAKLAELSGIPRPRIYDVLRNLETKGVVLKEAARIKPNFSAVPIGDCIEIIKANHAKRIEEIENFGKTLKKTLEPLYEKVATDTAFIIKGTENIYNWVLREINKTEHHIYFLGSGKRGAILSLPRLEALKSLYKAIGIAKKVKNNRGIEVKACITLHPKIIPAAKKGTEFVDLRCMDKEPDTEMYLFDGERGLITSSSIHGGPFDLGIFIISQDVCKALERQFLSIHEQAKPASERIEEMERR